MSTTSHHSTGKATKTAYPAVYAPLIGGSFYILPRHFSFVNTIFDFFMIKYNKRRNVP